MRWAIVVVMLVVGCGGRGGSTPEPTQRPTPAPTPVPWDVAVDSATYSTEAPVGGSIIVVVTITNSGSARNPGVLINFSELDKYADLLACKPTCELEDLPGLGPSAVLPGVAAGETVEYSVEFVAKEVGAAQWSLCVYDNTDFGDQVYCGDASTAIR